MPAILYLINNLELANRSCNEIINFFQNFNTYSFIYIRKFSANLKAENTRPSLQDADWKERLTGLNKQSQAQAQVLATYWLRLRNLQRNLNIRDL
jgi:hypothetical protein